MLRLLLVDDDAPVLQMLKVTFEAGDFSVTTAASATEAIHTLSATSFDIVVTDMRMETRTSGYDVIRAAKAQPHPTVAVILSAFPIPATEWRPAGADALFMKGGGIARMLEDLKRMVRTARHRRS